MSKMLKSKSVDIFGSLASKESGVLELTLLGLGLIKINDVSANFNNPC